MSVCHINRPQQRRVYYSGGVRAGDIDRQRPAATVGQHGPQQQTRAVPYELYFSVKCDKGPNRKVARPTIVWNETG